MDNKQSELRMYSQEYVSALLADNEALKIRVGQQQSVAANNLDMFRKADARSESLLAELEQANKRAEVESVGADKSAADCVQWMRRTEAAEKRIAELEGDKRQLNEIINTEANRADAAEKQLVYSRDAMATWERKAISNFEECAKMSQCIEELEKRLATPVRLPEPDVNNYGYESIGYRAVLSALSDAGVTFTVEGDE
ncbi:hypothetical protein [Serratia plymuthica]|uniref:hypothetical protein n=1 Tax=Serratia plymuthica TaxID=82996 RepID=UPI0007EB99A5|nr:hypothetical protein [Serratia plymuthica]ANJ99069.1 hypothetical protein ADP73_14375 [Serratia plymuthica]